MRAKRDRKHPVLAVAGLLALGLVLAACGQDDGDGSGGDAAAPDEASAEQTEDPAETDEPVEGTEEPEETADDGFPDRNMRWIIASSAGGGFDSSSRQLQPYLEKQLDTSFQVENLTGGGFSVGANALLNDGGDCYTIMTHGTPVLLLSSIFQDVDYTIEDFYPLGAYTQDVAAVFAHPDSEFETMTDVVEAARERPGEITVSVSAYTEHTYFAIMDLQEQADIELNVVLYEGGNEARMAVVNREVDLTVFQLYATAYLWDELRILGVFAEENEWREVTDTEPIDDQLDVDLGDRFGIFDLWVSAECKENHPERYERLLDAFLEATDDPEYLEMLDELGELEKIRVVPGPEHYEYNLEIEPRMRAKAEEVMADIES